MHEFIILFRKIDNTQEGYIKKDNYLSKFGEIEFGLLTLNETSDEYITFDKFMEFEFNNNSVQQAVNDDVLDVTEIDLTKHTMQNLHLQRMSYTCFYIIPLITYN